MSFSSKLRVGVLRGGPSPEYDVSLKTGGAILSNMPEEYEPLDIFISKDGIWHSKGLEKKPYDILKTVDAVVNALHGSYGEDGTVQKMLERFHIPYTGSDSFASALGMNKEMSKRLFRLYGVKTPNCLVFDREEGHISQRAVSRIFESLIFPIIVKPLDCGSSLGVSVARGRDEISRGLESAFQYSPKAIVEEYIEGKEATCGVIEGWRDKEYYALLPVEVEKAKSIPFHDYISKYVLPSRGFGSRYRVPGNFSHDEKEALQEAALKAHKALGLKHYSRADFIVHPKRGIFVLEVNTLPELTHRSSFVKSLEAVGGNMQEFLSHLLHKTLRR